MHETLSRHTVCSTVDTSDYVAEWSTGEMQLPWDLGLMDEPQDTSETMVSEDIWKKFDLDLLPDRPPGPTSSSGYNDHVMYNTMFSQTYRLADDAFWKLGHHDCMWAGLCISKAHNRPSIPPVSTQVQSKVPAGASLLISRAGSTTSYTSQSSTIINTSQDHRPNLESDGDSTRPETPQSSNSDMEDDEKPKLDWHTRMHDYAETAMMNKAVHLSEITGQQVKRYHLRKKEKTNEQQNSYQTPRETNIRNTLSDHCYHLNHSASQKLDYLGVPTPSESEEEEEIDVVSFEKPIRPVTLPTSFSPAEQQRFQLTMNTAFHDKPAPRPRGRPPSNPNRKRKEPYAQHTENQTPTKRSNRNCQKREKTKIQSRNSSDDELDTEKRSQHNNMERMRRIELRDAFEDLRRLVPQVNALEKAPKVSILKHAANFCKTLSQQNESNLQEIRELKRTHRQLEQTLLRLQRETHTLG